MGVQEHHLPNDTELEKATDLFDSKGICFPSNTQFSELKDQSVLETWKLIKAWVMHPRILHATLHDAHGIPHSFLVSHLDDHADIRAQQWRKLSSFNTSLLPLDTTYLSDQNSILLPPETWQLHI